MFELIKSLFTLSPEEKAKMVDLKWEINRQRRAEGKRPFKAVIIRRCNK